MTGNIESAELAGNVTQSLSIMGMVINADIVVQMVILLLLLASFWSWSVIFTKIFLYKKVARKITRFEANFWSGQLIEQIYERVQKSPDNPMAYVFVAAMHEWHNRSKKKKLDGVKERIYGAMAVARNREIERLEGQLYFLPTLAASAPFVGLFGTVWGIMNSFQSIAMSKNTTLVVVAPGIAEALLATAIGLFAAIPAVIFYNILARKVNILINRIDDFASELGNLLSKEIDERE